MKAIYTSVLALFSCLLQYDTQAQNVKIPDPNFKNALIYRGVDLNGDGEIQVSEAQKVTRLYVDKAGINALTGIKSFSNLEEFGFYDNQITVLDLGGLKKLRSVYGFNNQIQTVNVTGLDNLQTLYLHENKIRVIDVSGLKKLKELKLDKNMLGSIVLNNLPALEEVELSQNLITEFNASGLPGLRKLKLQENRLSALDLGSFRQLETADLSENAFLSSLNISGLALLQSLSCTPNRLVNLNMSGTVSLTQLEW
jgi:protein phosphatase 1 regulatory subunit 7